MISSVCNQFFHVILYRIFEVILEVMHLDDDKENKGRTSTDYVINHFNKRFPIVHEKEYLHRQRICLTNSN